MAETEFDFSLKTKDFFLINTSIYNILLLVAFMILSFEANSTAFLSFISSGSKKPSVIFLKVKEEPFPLHLL